MVRCPVDGFDLGDAPAECAQHGLTFTAESAAKLEQLHATLGKLFFRDDTVPGYASTVGLLKHASAAVLKHIIAVATAADGKVDPRLEALWDGIDADNTVQDASQRLQSLLIALQQVEQASPLATS